jgi:hypothetical protein
MIVPQPKPNGPTVPTVPTNDPAPHRSGSPADGDQNHPQDPATRQTSGTESDPILCRHCGRTASNGISCEGSCVADSGY